MYKTDEIRAEIAIKDYVKDFVDVNYFLEFCKNCPHYENNWGCPPFDFDPIDLWNKYKTFSIIGIKIIFDDDIVDKTYSSDELSEIMSKSIRIEKNKLFNRLLEMEKDIEESTSVVAGTCNICNECGRENGEKCRHPDKLRHSVESLGGNVEKTVKELLNLDILWVEDYKLPKYLTLCCGLLH